MKILAVGTLPKTIQNNLRKRNKHSSKKETLKRFKSKFQVFFCDSCFSDTYKQ